MDPKTELPTVFDSEQQHIGNVYAKALIGVGQARGKLESLLEELHSLVVDVLPKVQNLRSVLESPRISLPAKSAVLDKAFRAKASPEFLNFLKLLCHKHRFDCVDAIDRAAKKLFNEMRNRDEAVLITAFEVDDEIRQRVRQQLEKMLQKEVEVRSEVDEAIVGGFIVKVGDTVFDGSLVNQLQQVRRVAVEKTNLEIRKSIDRFVTP
ncbi:MAG TPA: ATP synthase F1 subunit delta [Pirellulaceae bacterium]|nr:ATP synthase F1 subunit delta [Pirellulaceae bacterium]HMP68531.1 ATP synthase F1 subunit delta [Pirellulaceae bacterium]